MSETCTMCGKPLGSAADLVEHMAAVHKHDDPTSSVEMNPEAHAPGVVCALCGRRFPNAKALAEHNLRPHPRQPGTPWSGPTPG
jgi:hypothetical protein